MENYNVIIQFPQLNSIWKNLIINYKIFTLINAKNNYTNNKLHNNKKN